MKFKNNHYNKFNLQLFAEGEGDAGADAGADNTAAEGGEAKVDPRDEKKHSDNDVDRIVKSKYAKWKADYDKELNEAKEEAAKLAKMNAEQKQKYELDKITAENEKLKKQMARIELEKTSAGLLAEKNIDATQEILDFVVGDDAETTNANIDKFVKIVEAQVKKAEIARATGTTPRNITNNGNTMSEFDKRIAKYN